MTAIVNAGSPWPSQANLPGRRLLAHQKMVLLHSYLTQLGLTSVPFSGCYDVAGSEIQVPEFTNNGEGTGMSSWMRFDWTGGVASANALSIYVAVELNHFFNNNYDRRENKYFLACAIRGAPNDANPLAAGCVRSSPPGSVDAASSAYYVIKEAETAGDFLMAASNRLYVNFCARSVGGLAISVRPALCFYIERFDDIDCVWLNNTAHDGASMSGSPKVISRDTGTVIGSAITSYGFPDGIAARGGVPVIQRIPVYNAADYYESKYAFLAPRASFADYSVKTLDFSGEEKKYFAAWEYNYRPGNSDELTMLIEWDDS